MAEHSDDKELLFQFKNEATREAAFTRIIKKYQEKLILAYPPDGG
jgi:hypothetical protein